MDCGWITFTFSWQFTTANMNPITKITGRLTPQKPIVKAGTKATDVVYLNNSTPSLIVWTGVSRPHFPCSHMLFVWVFRCFDNDHILTTYGIADVSNYYKLKDSNMCYCQQPQWTGLVTTWVTNWWENKSSFITTQYCFQQLFSVRNPIPSTVACNIPVLVLQPW